MNNINKLQNNNQKEYIIESTFKIQIATSITSMTLIDNNKIILGDNLGNLFLWDRTINQVLFLLKTKQKSITDLLSLPNYMLLSSSEDGTMKLWQFYNNQLILWHTYEFSMEPILQSIYIDDNRIASFCIDGFVFIYSIDNRQFIMDASLYYVPIKKNYGCLAYSKRDNTLIKLINGNIYFVTLNPYRIEKEIISNINVHNKNNVCVTKEGKLIVEQYTKNDMKVMFKIMIINIKTRQIESIIYNKKCFYSVEDNYLPFIEEYADSYFIVVPNNIVQFYDKKKLNIKQRYICENKIYYHSIISLFDRNEYISLCKQNIINIKLISIYDSFQHNTIHNSFFNIFNLNGVSRINSIVNELLNRAEITSTKYTLINRNMQYETKDFVKVIVH